MTILILFFLVSIIFSFLCSIWEAVLLSIPPSQVEIEFQKGHWVGRRLKAFKSNIDRPLAAILTLNTIAHTVGAIGVGAQAAQIWGSHYLQLGPLNLSVEALIAALMTLSILILSEIIPKTLGANYWKGLTSFTTYCLHGVILALYPLVWLAQGITKVLKKDKQRSVLSRADFSAMARIGAKSGIFEQKEYKVIKNLLRFSSIQARDIMTPRTVVIAAQEDETIGHFHKEHEDLRFSRIPLYADTKDHVTGFFLKDDMLNSIIRGKRDEPLGTIKRPIMIVAEVETIPEIFEKLIQKKEHITMVTDEYGGMAGIVTMEDIIETLLGLEILDELDDIADLQQLARENWKKRAEKLGLIEGS